jgi:hypothetical protein
MSKWLFRDLLSPSGLWSLAQWLFPAATTSVSAWLSVGSKLPPSLTFCLAILSGAGAFAFVTTLRQNSIFQKLSLHRLYPLHWHFNVDDQVGLMQLRAVFRNNHPYETIFYRCELLNIVIQGRTHPNPLRVGDGSQISPLGEEGFVFPMVNGLRTGEASGMVHFRVCYGKSRDDLRHVLEMRLALKGLIATNGAAGPFLTLNWFIEETRST